MSFKSIAVATLLAVAAPSPASSQCHTYSPTSSPSPTQSPTTDSEREYECKYFNPPFGPAKYEGMPGKDRSDGDFTYSEFPYQEAQPNMMHCNSDEMFEALHDDLEMRRKAWAIEDLLLWPSCLLRGRRLPLLNL